MVPGFAFFYGGTADRKNVLTAIVYCLFVFCVAIITQSLISYSLAFGNPTVANGFIGNCFYCGLTHLQTSPIENTSLPSITFFLFQIVRGALTPVIFIYSIIGRVRVFFLILLTICFSIIVYAPLAYWHWNHNGWLFKFGAIDFSGGNVIHLAAGFAGLASYYYMGIPENRKEAQTVQSITLSLKGVGMLWFGWLGFAGGAALSANSIASQAVTATLLSCCAGGIAWAAMYYVVTDKPSLQGWCNGSICALVAISSGSGYVPLWSSIVIGLVSGLISFFFCYYKSVHFG
jgi:Amt family ammonium transporter